MSCHAARSVFPYSSAYCATVRTRCFAVASCLTLCRFCTMSVLPIALSFSLLHLFASEVVSVIIKITLINVNNALTRGKIYDRTPYPGRTGKNEDGYRWIQAVPWLNQQKIYPMWFLTD